MTRRLARVRAKICGVTNREDAEAAIACGADALGFNLYPGSKRCIDLAHERAWIATLPPWVVRVAVLVNAPLEAALAAANDPAIDAVQFHGDEDAAYCAQFAASGRGFIRALRLRSAADLAAGGDYSTPHLLIEAHSSGAYGGTGQMLDLALAREFIARHSTLHVILAGGLRPDNVAAAIAATRPYGVDTASGVERPGEPRRKDPALLQSFLSAVQDASLGGGTPAG